jgi:hypothetical protein
MPFASKGKKGYNGSQGENCQLALPTNSTPKSILERLKP